MAEQRVECLGCTRRQDEGNLRHARAYGMGMAPAAIQTTVLVALAGMLCGCTATPSRLLDPPAFQTAQESWQFLGHPGALITTDHFDFHTTVVDSELRDYLPEFLETMYQFYGSILPASDESLENPPRMRTFLFATRAEWDAFTRHRFPQRHALYRKITAGGYSEGDTCVVYNIGRAPTLSVIAHEGWHQYLASQVSEPVPAWLNEGLATYCESIEFRRNRPYFVPQHNSFRINHLCNAFNTGATLRLKDLLGTDAGQVIDNNQSADTTTYYAQAWALIVYLQHGERGRYHRSFQRILDDLKSGTLHIQAQAAQIASANPSETSFGEAVFLAYVTGDLDSFEADFDEFAYRLCWRR